MQKIGKAPRIFLDANVIFSAAYSSEGRSAALFLFARRKRCRLISSRFALEEAHRNLAQQRSAALKLFARNLPWIHIVPEGSALLIEKVTSIGLDSGDVPILAAAIGHASMLVTGDLKHFGRWMGKTIFDIRILGLADALELLIEGKSE